MIIKVDDTKCTGCGICVEICPMDVLRLDTSNGKAYIAYLEDCMTCFNCELACPTYAIDVSFTPVARPLIIECPQGGKKYE